MPPAHLLVPAPLRPEVGYHRNRHTYLNLISKLPWGKKVRVMYSESFVILEQSNLGVVDFLLPGIMYDISPTSFVTLTFLFRNFEIR